MKKLKWEYPLIIVLVLTLALSGYFHIRNSEVRTTKRQTVNHGVALEALQHKLAYAHLLAAADEAFISESYEEAFALYRQADAHPEAKKTTLPLRKTQAEKLKTSSVALLQARQQLKEQEQKLSSLDESHLELREVAEKLEKLRPLQEIQYQLVLTQQQKAIDSLSAVVATQQDNLKLYQFVNEKGNQVYYIGGHNQNGKAEGHGIGIWETGGIYTGDWKENQRHGQGVYKWADGERYEGQFEHGKRHGQGTYFFKNGEKYVGDWNQDKRHGEGILYHKNGKVKVQGIWEDDQFRNESARR